MEVANSWPAESVRMFNRDVDQANMEFLFEIVFQIVGELLIQVVLELLAEAGLRGLGAPFRRKSNPWLAAFGYLLFGALAGAISLAVFPDLLLKTPAGRIVNLMLTPVIAGGMMVLLGAWRRRRQQELLRLDRFACGYLFALALGSIRFWFAG
jgi:hypothetical protein